MLKAVIFLGFIICCKWVFNKCQAFVYFRNALTTDLHFQEQPQLQNAMCLCLGLLYLVGWDLLTKLMILKNIGCIFILHQFTIGLHLISPILQIMSTNNEHQ